MKPTQGWGAVGAVLLAVALFSLNRGHGRVCTKRDMCREDEDGTMRCNWLRCPGCAVVVHSDKELEFDFRCRRGLPEGRGIFTLDSGDVYSGNFRQGAMHGHGRYLWRNGDEYEGQWVHDLMEGHGVLVMNDGARYEGSFNAGRMHGHGTFVWPSGANYTGGFADGLHEGDGVLHLADGSRYRGHFRGGLRHGWGRFEARDVASGELQLKYEGDWSGGKRHGQGRYTLEDGSVVKGAFENDLVHGTAIKTNPKGDVVARGEWKSGKLAQAQAMSG